MLEVFSYSFMVRAFIGGAIVALIAPMMGTFLVIRRYSYMADTLAHVSLVGIAGGLLLNFDPIVGALAVTILASLGIENLRKVHGLFGESLLALFLSGSLAISAVLISLADGFNSDLFSFLFGSITTVSSSDLWQMGALAVVVVLVVAFAFDKFFLLSFDEDLAKVEGINTKVYNFLLIVLAALTVSVAIQIVGVLLIGALMVIPTLTAFLWRRSFMRTVIIAIVVAELSTFLGLYASYYLDLASGGTIVLLTLLCFLISLTSRKVLPRSS